MSWAEKNRKVNNSVGRGGQGRGDDYLGLESIDLDLVYQNSFSSNETCLAITRH